MSIISTRKHAIMRLREAQLVRNELAVNGGRPYIDARLWRAPNETDLSWQGDAARGIVGRRERACLVNDAGRVANKINQYIFRQDITRNGVDDAFAADATGTGVSLDSLMEQVCKAVTYGGWCWLQVDRAPQGRDADGSPIAYTLADRTPIRLTKWDAVDVPDWRLDDDGSIAWLVTRSKVYDNSDPRLEPRVGIVSTLYERVDGKIYITEECDNAAIKRECRTREEVPGLDQIPFVLVGKPSEKAWWFDDIEQIQAQCLNLDSSHNETLTDSVYPQMVLPMSLVNSIEATLREDGVNGERVVALVRELTVGRHTPIIEAGDDKGISRYIAPSGDLKLLTEEITRKRSLLFDVAGLALMNRETRQVQSAESKQFDQLDTSATLANRAMLLQNAETRVCALARVFDPAFAVWEPQYPTRFDVVDVAAMAQAVQVICNLPSLTHGLKQAALRCSAKILKELGAVTPAEETAIVEEIDALKDEPPVVMPDLYGDDDDAADDDGDEPPNA